MIKEEKKKAIAPKKIVKVVEKSKTEAKVEVKKGVAKKMVRIIKGVIVSDKMDKTVVVKVDRLVKHLKYHKRYLISKKYKVHDPENRFKQGEEIKFVECQPISKDKKWKAIYE